MSEIKKEQAVSTTCPIYTQYGYFITIHLLENYLMVAPVDLAA